MFLYVSCFCGCKVICVLMRFERKAIGLLKESQVVGTVRNGMLHGLHYLVESCHYPRHAVGIKHTVGIKKCSMFTWHVLRAGNLMYVPYVMYLSEDLIMTTPMLEIKGMCAQRLSVCVKSFLEACATGRLFYNIVASQVLECRLCVIRNTDYLDAR